MDIELPIVEALPALLEALRARGRCVLQAPPGAGKTTRVPLALMDHVAGRILMLEPRRLAARAAAERMAQTLGEQPGGRVGFRIRGDTVVSPTTRIEVVTEGILTRMIQSDPALTGVGAVIFDEFHERSLNADLGLALVTEAAAALRPDLALVVMSATLDAGPVAQMLDAPVVTAQGRAHAVETRWLDRPAAAAEDPLRQVTDCVIEAVAKTEGGVLVFLPGEAEIRRTAARLAGRLPDDCRVLPLYGAMDFAAQRAAIAPAAAGRKIVLATAIAETSLTIEDIRVVVDAGRARRARFDPGSGMARLVTERASRAEADQRRGRAGRVAAGVCYRLWSRGEEGAMPAFAPPEIENADLAGLVLELALWGARDPAGLAFLTPPNPGAYAAAQALLQGLGALDRAGAITAHGRALAALPVHPRLGHMLLEAGAGAAPLAALLSDRDPLGREAPADLTLRLEALSDIRRYRDRHPWPADQGALARIGAEARRLARLAPPDRGLTPAEMAALAYPDRIGLRRAGDAPRWLLSGGKGACLASSDPLAGTRMIVATTLDGDPREARIRLAIPIGESALRAVHGTGIAWHEVCRWSRRDRRVIARREERLGALVLDDRTWRDAPPATLAAAAAEGVRMLGFDALAPAPAMRRLQARVALLRAEGADCPDCSDAALMERLDEWLTPYLGGCRSAADLARLDAGEPLRHWLGRDRLREVERLAPAAFVTPLGRQVPIDYGAETPTIELRLQELFGVEEHPRIGPRRLPLRIVLLSPAGRPLQVTTDLPGFWAGAYAEVRKEMRGRYPRHPWPEDPAAAAPTTRTKPRRG